MSRDLLRAAIFAAENKKPKSEIVQFFGVDIELRQASLGDVLDARAESEADEQAAVIKVLVRQAYVPGTDERVFEDADAESLRRMPFGGDFIRINKAIEKLTELDFLPTSDGSEKTESDSQS